MSANELLVTGGRVLTMDPERPEARSVLVRDGRVLAVSDVDVPPATAPRGARVVDLRGGCVTPGIIDAHGHPDHLGEILETVDLREARSLDDVVERLRRGAPSAGWVLGRNWDQSRWQPPAMPDHRPLTAAFPDRPVWLVRVDLHAGWGNAALLAEAGVDRSTADPPGGRIERRPCGDPTGLLVDRAMHLVEPPEVGPDDVERRLLRAQEHLLDLGITAVHHMGVDAAVDRAYRRLDSEGPGGRRLRIRVHGYARRTLFEERAGEAPDSPRPRGRYELAGVKLFADGALGSHGALLGEDYADRAGERGLALDDPARIEAMTRLALESGWQVAVHAIGDEAVRRVLDAFERARDGLSSTDGRLRLEHASIVRPDDLPRIRRGGIVASVQPTFATSDHRWIEDRLGSRRSGWAYAFRRMLAAGVPLALGSDFPVELADPRLGLHAAIGRCDLSGEPEGGWGPRQRLTPQEALRGYTSGGAFAAGREGHVGRIRPGFAADMTCFGVDLLSVPVEQYPSAPVLATIVGGRIVAPGDGGAEAVAR